MKKKYYITKVFRFTPDCKLLACMVIDKIFKTYEAADKAAEPYKRDCGIQIIQMEMA